MFTKADVIRTTGKLIATLVNRTTGEAIRVRCARVIAMNGWTDCVYQIYPERSTAYGEGWRLAEVNRVESNPAS